MSEWDEAKAAAEKGGDSNFIRLVEDRSSVVVAICGKPHIRRLFWNESAETFDPYTDAHKAAGARLTERFVVNAYVPAENAMKIMEFSKTAFKIVLQVKEKYGLEKWLFEVERSGAKGYNKTTYTVLPEKEIDSALRKTIAALPLHDLVKACEDGGDAATDMSSHDKKANGTNGAHAAAPAAPAIITPAQVALLVPRLKAMPKARIDEFLAKFKTAKVKEMHAEHFTTAVALLDEWEGVSLEAAEVDPFG